MMNHIAMLRLRSFLSILLVLVTTVLVSCGSPKTAAIPTTYSPEKIEQLQVFVEPITEAREKMSVLQKFIAERNWTDTITYIHGPLGQLRLDMTNLSRSLLPKDQKQAMNLAKEVFSRFERLDTAAKERNIADAEYQYRKAVDNFDAFLNLVPENS